MRRILGELTAFFVFLLIFAWALCGCGLVGAAKPRVERFDCQVRAFKPLVDDVLDAEQLVRDLYAGRANMAAVLGNLQATAPELLKLQADLAACEPPPPEAKPEPKETLL